MGGSIWLFRPVMGREAHGEVGRLACIHPLGDHLLLLKVLVLLVVPILLEGETGRRKKDLRRLVDDEPLEEAGEALPWARIAKI